MQQGLLREDELGGNVMISPMLVQIPTNQFELAVFPNRLQMSFRGPKPGAKEDLTRVLGGTAKLLPHTPFSACGLNFNYLATVGQDAYAAWSRRLFDCDAARRACANDRDDARYGTYFSFDCLGGRLKVDAKPTRTSDSVKDIAPDWEADVEVVRISLNYHFECKEPPLSMRVISILEKWQDVALHSYTIASAFGA